MNRTAETFAEPSAIDRKSEPEHQAQMKWARDAVSNLVIPLAETNCNQAGTTPSAESADLPAPTPRGSLPNSLGAYSGIVMCGDGVVMSDEDIARGMREAMTQMNQSAETKGESG